MIQKVHISQLFRTRFWTWFGFWCGWCRWLSNHRVWRFTPWYEDFPVTNYRLICVWEKVNRQVDLRGDGIVFKECILVLGKFPLVVFTKSGVSKREPVASMVHVLQVYLSSFFGSSMFPADSATSSSFVPFLSSMLTIYWTSSGTSLLSIGSKRGSRRL